MFLLGLEYSRVEYVECLPHYLSPQRTLIGDLPSPSRTVLSSHWQYQRQWVPGDQKVNENLERTCSSHVRLILGLDRSSSWVVSARLHFATRVGHLLYSYSWVITHIVFLCLMALVLDRYYLYNLIRLRGSTTSRVLGSLWNSPSLLAFAWSVAPGCCYSAIRIERRITQYRFVGRVPR